MRLRFDNDLGETYRPRPMFLRNLIVGALWLLPLTAVAQEGTPEPSAPETTKKDPLPSTGTNPSGETISDETMRLVGDVDKIPDDEKVRRVDGWLIEVREALKKGIQI